jgi:hypothetical protein
MILVIKDRKSPAGVKCITEGQNQNKKMGEKKMQNFELSADKNSITTLAGPDTETTEILQRFRSSPRGLGSMKQIHFSLKS